MVSKLGIRKIVSNTLCGINGDQIEMKPVGTINTERRDPHLYTYEESINLTGHGPYSLGLLLVLSIATLAMGIDMFGFSVILSGCECEFHLDLSQKSILLSMPFIGPIVMAYPWGYLSDTKGRKKCLLISLWGSFLVTFISAFSTNWYWLAILKFFSTSFCSCAQSATYTMLGECCSTRIRDPFMLVMTAILDFCLAIYVGTAYLVLNMEFSFDLGFITFTPWRLLIMVLALPLGISAFLMHFHYESPKFLLNDGREEEALDALRHIWRRNGGDIADYPVKRLILDEEGNDRLKNISLLQSLWDQIVPLFKPPFLWRTLQLYYLTAAIYSTNNSFFIWFPFLSEIMVAGISSSLDENQLHGLCNMIDSFGKNSTSVITCIPKIEVNLVWASITQGISFIIITFIVTYLAARKRMLMIIILLVASVSATGAALINDDITSFIMFFGLLANELCIGIVFSYFVDLYPTSYRGMAACLAVMVARSSGLAGVNLVGAFVASNCGMTFYFSSAYLLSAVAVSCLLPPDKIKK